MCKNISPLAIIDLLNVLKESDFRTKFKTKLRFFGIAAADAADVPARPPASAEGDLGRRKEAKNPPKRRRRETRVGASDDDDGQLQ